LLAVAALTGVAGATASGAGAQAPIPSSPSATTTEPPNQPTTPASQPSAEATSPPAIQGSGGSPAGEDPQRVTADDLMNHILRRALDPASSIPAATTGPGAGSDAWQLGVVAALAGGAGTVLCAREIRRRRRSVDEGGTQVEAGVSEAATMSSATVEAPTTTATTVDQEGRGASVERAPAFAGEPPPGPGDVGVWVGVLGPVEVNGLPGELGDRHKLTEVLVYLATHGERPVRGEALMCACWPERDIASTTFNQAISRLRRHLGTADSGERRLPADGGAYRLGPDVGCDWTTFRALVKQAKTAEPSVAVTAYREALSLVRGEPFAAVGRGTYSWAWSEQLVYEIERAVVQAALALGELALSEDDAETARWAAVQGRAASPFEPSLFEIQIRAAEQTGDEGELARVREAADVARRLLAKPAI